MRIRRSYSVTPPPAVVAPPPDLFSSTTAHFQHTQQISGGGGDNNYCYVSPPVSCVSQNQQNQSHVDSGYRPPVMVSRIKASNIGHSDKNPRNAAGDEGNTSMEKSVNEYGKSSNSSISSEMSATSSVSSSLSRHGWWCEEEKVFPLKKRKISLERFIISQESESNIGSRMEMNNYLRCSKNNGKGWRCKRKRLDSSDAWCEYHVKKSRFRYHWKKKSHDDEDEKNKCWGSKMKKNKNVGGRKDFMVEKENSINNKKRKRTMLISSILERTVPLLANTNTS